MYDSHFFSCVVKTDNSAASNQQADGHFLYIRVVGIRNKLPLLTQSAFCLCGHKQKSRITNLTFIYAAKALLAFNFVDKAIYLKVNRVDVYVISLIWISNQRLKNPF